MKNLLNQVSEILKLIEISAVKTNRKLSDINVIAATKTQDYNTISQLINNTSIKIAGENKVQELLEKYNPSIVWDFIGQLQSNKVKYIIDKVRLIHSVDRTSLAMTIDKLAYENNKVQDILIQVNSGKEESKGGIFNEDVINFAEKIANYKNIAIRGLMIVAPMLAEKSLLIDCFNSSKASFDSLAKLYPNIDYLSMGMSNDFELAIECGSNMIRLGRTIFGERIYN